MLQLNPTNTGLLFSSAVHHGPCGSLGSPKPQAVPENFLDNWKLLRRDFSHRVCPKPVQSLDGFLPVIDVSQTQVTPRAFLRNEIAN